MTRQQIINLIRQYIYTNGNQKVTAAQLREILLEIANTFAIENGTASGIEAVLEAGNEVGDDQKIVNGKGASLFLSASADILGQIVEYMGMRFTSGTYDTGSIVIDNQYSVGVAKRTNPEHDLLNMYFVPLEEGEIVLGTTYMSDGIPEVTNPGIFSVAKDAYARTSHQIRPDSVKIDMKDLENEENNSHMEHSLESIGHYLYRGPQSSEHEQGATYIKDHVYDNSNQFWSDLSSQGIRWGNGQGEISRIDGDGLRLSPDAGQIQLHFSSDSTGGVVNVYDYSGMSRGLTLSSPSLFFNLAGSRVFAMNASQTSVSNYVNVKGLKSTLSTEGDNVAVAASASNGKTNIAFLGESGDLKMMKGAVVLANNVPAPAEPDTFSLYSADQRSGNAAPHFRTENGSVIRLYQETKAIEESVLSGRSGRAVTDIDTFDGYTLKQVVKALRNFGLLE